MLLPKLVILIWALEWLWSASRNFGCSFAIKQIYHSKIKTFLFIEYITRVTNRSAGIILILTLN